jgi:response regulator RpfG family c-di-GMP phosphodiesterase
MDSWRKVGKIFLVAGLFWFCDSLLLNWTSDANFWQAIWIDAGQVRLLYRLVVVLLIFMAGFTFVLRREMEYLKVMRMNSTSREVVYGAPDSPRQSQRLVFYALRLAGLLKMSPREQDKLRILCYCHDIGLIGVHSSILEKQSALTAAEQALFDEHISLGAAIMANIPRLAIVARLISCHEERYDGGGFHGIYGKNIPLACRILTLVMMFDYFSQPQRGRRAMEISEALDEMEMYVGSILDPDVMTAFRRLFSDRRLAAAAAARVYVNS